MRITPARTVDVNDRRTFAFDPFAHHEEAQWTHDISKPARINLACTISIPAVTIAEIEATNPRRHRQIRRIALRLPRLHP